MKALRILYIIPSFNYGGSERKVVDLALNLNRDFFAAYVMSISEDGVLKKELDDGGIPSVCVKKKSKFDIFVVFRICRFIKKNKIDIVHVFTSTAKLWGRLACMGNKKVVVVSTEESLFRGLRSDVFFERLFNKSTSVIVANSHATMMSAIEKTHISEAKYRVIYNGINLKRFSDYKGNRDSDRHFYKIPADKSVILHIGRFDDRKGHKYLLKAMPLILQEKPDAFLVLAGEGETMVSMIELIDELKINEQVLLVGYVADLPKLYHTADVFVLPSVAEGFGNVIVEAMASGIPVIAAAAGGIPEIIEHEQTGLLFPPKDEDAIAKAYLRLTRDDELKTSLVGNALKNISKFSLETQVDSYQKLYLELSIRGEDR
jgi:glycosyltransferase involved in cell wall biosynthesis